MSTKEKDPTFLEIVEAYEVMSEEALQDEIDYFTTQLLAILESRNMNYLKASFPELDLTLIVASEIDKDAIH
jgi:DnaJ-class molecular chaperone